MNLYFCWFYFVLTNSWNCNPKSMIYQVENVVYCTLKPNIAAQWWNRLSALSSYHYGHHRPVPKTFVIIMFHYVYHVLVYSVKKSDKNTLYHANCWKTLLFVTNHHGYSFKSWKNYMKQNFKVCLACIHLISSIIID